MTKITSKHCSWVNMSIVFWNEVKIEQKFENLIVKGLYIDNDLNDVAKEAIHFVGKAQERWSNLR